MPLKAKSNGGGWVRHRRGLCARHGGVVLALSLLGPSLGGCAMSYPMGSMLPDDVTGALAKVPFGALLDAEDRRRETAALDTALDPQGDGAAVRWENPSSGRKGGLTAVGHAYPKDGSVCRAFLADLRDGATSRTIQGTACLAHAGDWEIEDAKPLKRA